MAIQIKEGRYYKDGHGQVCGPASLAWCVPLFGGRRVYDPDGSSILSHDPIFNLVSECDKDGNPIEDAMSEAAQLVMKEGAYYEDGRGRTRGPLGCSLSKDYPWRVIDAFGSLTFTEFGRVYSGDEPDSEDLVREVPAPTLAAPKPETVTITQEMVDRAILDAVKAGDLALAADVNDAWDDLRRVMKPATS